MKKIIYLVFLLFFITGCRSADYSMKDSHPLYHSLQVFYKNYDKKYIYVNWGRNSNPIKVGKDFDSINVGDRIILEEKFYPRYSVKYVGKK